MILSAQTAIGQETAGQLHDRLMLLGSQTVIETLQLIEKGNVSHHSKRRRRTQNRLQTQ
jgi:methionyl-tRNA formyltransferase